MPQCSPRKPPAKGQSQSPMYIGLNGIIKLSGNHKAKLTKCHSRNDSSRRRGAQKREASLSVDRGVSLQVTLEPLRAIDAALVEDDRHVRPCGKLGIGALHRIAIALLRLDNEQDFVHKASHRQR
jgi:hypothetical protein